MYWTDPDARKAQECRDSARVARLVRERENLDGTRMLVGLVTLCAVIPANVTPIPHYISGLLTGISLAVSTLAFMAIGKHAK